MNILFQLFDFQAFINSFCFFAITKHTLLLSYPYCLGGAPPFLRIKICNTLLPVSQNG